MYRGPGRDAVAWDAARVYDMIFTQPVVHEFPKLTVPTVLMSGDKDITAIGGDGAPPKIRATLGHYPEMGQTAASAIPHATLIEFPTLGPYPAVAGPDRLSRETHGSPQVRNCS